jgi:signal transduction histidine kinase
MEKIIKFVNIGIKDEANELGVNMWRTPSFLFILLGIVTMASMTVTYFISNKYDSPEIVIISECFIAIFIFSIGNYIIKGFEQVALLNKMKSEFISVASHQLRTPLSAMKWEIELLLSKLKEGLNSRQLEMIGKMSQSNERMIRMVNDLLDVVRLEQGRFALLREDLNLAEVVEEIIDEVAPLAKTSNVKIKFATANKLLEIKGDRKRIKMAVENLVTNAVKYSLNGGKIEIKIESQKDCYVFSVKDEGVGIPERQKSHVFEKFFRSDNVIKYQTDGTGLGLYIAKKIVEQSGGKIWFESKENVGSIFYFSLPVNIS